MAAARLAHTGKRQNPLSFDVKKQVLGSVRGRLAPVRLGFPMQSSAEAGERVAKGLSHRLRLFEGWFPTNPGGRGDV